MGSSLFYNNKNYFNIGFIPRLD